MVFGGHKSVVALRLVLSIAALSLFLLISPAMSHAITLDRIVAIIDKDVITWGELYKTMEFNLKEKVRDMSAKERLDFLKKYEKEFLERLIEMRLQLMYAETNHISISDKEIDSAIEDIQKKYSMTKDQMVQSLKKEGFVYEEYRKRLGEQILLQKVGGVIVAERAMLSDAEIAERAKSSKLSKGPLKYKLRLILISKKADNEENLLARKKAEDVYSQLAKGADFRTAAMQYSDDPSAASGGDLGYVAYDEMAKDLLTIVEGMKEGQISSLFVSPAGFNIVQLVEKKMIDTDEKVMAEIKAELLQEKAQQVHRDWLKSLKEKHFIKIIL
ncbi:MAG: peptidylprolyl isomerase [Candidatus Magnetominusculus sp. LBB02]|nr:peptidylprolyl isomerase [Candidatus Magnetominusculus sp. LBB02]